MSIPYDPRTLGAKCDECPLTGVNPCHSTIVADPKLVVVGEAPSENDEKDGKLFVGSPGFLLRQSLRRYNIKNSEVFLTSALLCKPPRRLTPKEWQRALDACRPRLEKELQLQSKETLLALGGRALQTLTGKSSITEWMGTPLETATLAKTYQMLATVTPTTAIRHPAEIPVFRIHVGRAIYLTDGTLPAWEWPRMDYTGDTPETAATLLALKGVRIAVDVETDGVDPLVNNLTCIGEATSNIAISVPWPPNHQTTHAALTALLAGPNTPKVMQNGQFDTLVLEAHDFEVKGFSFDTMLAHAIVAPGLMHKLDYIACVEFNVPRWKQTFRENRKGLVPSRVDVPDLTVWNDPRIALDRQKYNAQDCVVTARLYEPLSERIEQTHNGQYLFDQAMQLQTIAMRMREFGMLVDRTKFAGHRARLVEVMQAKEAAFLRLTNNKYALGKSGQSSDLYKLFFQDFNVTPLAYTAEGDPQMDAAFLEHCQGHMDPRVATIAKLVLDFRRAQKIISVYIDGLPIGAGDVVHPIWNIHGAITGRWSCNRPNAQNWPKYMRDLICSRPGHYIVGADFSQLELREAALLAEDDILLNMYAKNIDVHTETAKALFNVDTVTKEQRDCAKTIEYGFNYSSSEDVTTVWKTLHLKYPQITQMQVKKMRAIWFREHPRIAMWQLKQLKAVREDKAIMEPISGRMTHFHDGMVDDNQALNFPVQALAAELMNRATIRVYDALRPDEHIIAQVHDALYVEGPDKARLATVLKECMTQTLELHGNSLSFPVDVASGTDWYNLK